MEEVRENGLSARGVIGHTPSRCSIGPPAGVDFVVRVESGGILSFLHQTHTACCTCEAALPHLPLE